MAQWLSWLERRPVTAKVESSSLFWVVSNELTSLVNCIWIWNLSSAGRASALQAEGHRFEPYWSHNSNKRRKIYMPTLIEYADMAQLAEQLICNQQVIGSSPIVGSTSFIGIMDGFPSGQRGQTVNLLATLSKVRILLHPLSLTAKPMWLNWQSS